MNYTLIEGRKRGAVRAPNTYPLLLSGLCWSPYVRVPTWELLS